MSLPSMSSIPLLKEGITISPYQDDAAAASPRFLLVLEDSYFLVSAKARALVLALLRTPNSPAQLEHDFMTESGEHLPAPQLLALAAQTLPPVLFHAAPSAVRSMPFTLSVTLLPTWLAGHIATRLAGLFAPRLAGLLLVLFAFLHMMVLPAAMHGAHLAWSRMETIELISLLLLSGLIHELGHTAACRYFQCPHGAIGFGLYFIFPAWYADVSKAWRLSRKQRAVVDLGGVYFQAILLIAIDAYALVNGSPFALKLVWLITFTMLFTLNPVFKFDGYWLLSDLSGLHNLHQQVRQSGADLLARLLGRRTLAKPHNLVLYAYGLLSSGYFLYFSSFLLREVQLIARTLPAALLAGTAQLSDAASAIDGWQIGVALVQLAGALLWPAVVGSACFFFLDKLRRSLLEIGASVFAARALAGHAQPNTEHI